MSIREVVSIDSNKCDGCGLCISICAYCALEVVDGKATLISPILCNAQGTCTKMCPKQAISIKVEDAPEYDENEVLKNVTRKGTVVIKEHFEHMIRNNRFQSIETAIQYFEKNLLPLPQVALDFLKKYPDFHKNEAKDKRIKDWPPKLKYIKDPDFNRKKDEEILLLLYADCFALHEMGRKPFPENSRLLLYCPKMDTDTKNSIDSMVKILSTNNIKRCIIYAMNLPCCSEIEKLFSKAMQYADRVMEVKIVTLSLDGEMSEATID